MWRWIGCVWGLSAALALGCDAGDDTDYSRSRRDNNSSSDGDADGDADSDSDGDADTDSTLDAEAQAWLDAHNAVRHLANDGTIPGQPQAAPHMDDLAWDPLLAQVAGDYSENCVWNHNPNRVADYQALGGSGSVGENLWMTSSTSWSFDAAGVINSWYSEYSLFTTWEPIDNTNYHDIGHYTQLVWRDTTHVGCGYAFCPGLGTVVTCNYAPAGNFLGQYPY